MSVDKNSKIIKELSGAKQLSKEKLKEFPKEREEALKEKSIYTVDELREMILAEVQEEAEIIKQEAFEKGYSDGREEGLKVFLSELDRIKSLYNDLNQKIEKKVQEFIDSLTPEVVELSLRVARKVISAYVEIDKELVIRLIKEALFEISGAVENVRIEVNPEDLDLARKFLEGVENSFLKVELEPNPGVSRGGCIVETPTKFIDNQVEKRFNILEEEIKRKLLESKDVS